MSYFSRLTDIVTCNLTEILLGEDDPQLALRAMMAEMEEGLAGAKRSVATAKSAVERIESEIGEQQQQVESWAGQAKAALSAGNEDQARLSLIRKQEALDVLAGLEQQLQAARATHDHLSTTRRALEARIAEARRKLQHLEAGGRPDEGMAMEAASPGGGSTLDAERARQIEDELEALRRELA